jgi:hypothetical protein
VGDNEWRFTGFYANAIRSRRRKDWELLQYLRREFDTPWLCAGDFNEVLDASEQIGGNERQDWMMEGFRETVDYCRFSDLGYSGLPYTWNNKQMAPNNIKVRLDRGLGDDRFLDVFDSTTVRHIQTTSSDHCGLLIQIKRSEWLQGSGSDRPFRYENMWRQHDSYDQLVVSGWQDGAQSLEEVTNELGRMQHTLTSWSKSEFGSVKKQLNILRKKLDRVRLDSILSGPTKEECDLMKKISDLLAREETMMKQRSRVQWLAEGDRNTSFFHARARERARSNKITSLKNDDGNFVSSQSELESLASNFYSSLFTAQEQTTPEVITQFIQPKVSEVMNERLCAPVTNEEIENALFMMHPNKSPGPTALRQASISAIGVS